MGACVHAHACVFVRAHVRADESVAGTKRECEADEAEADDADTRDKDVLDENVPGVLEAHVACRSSYDCCSDDYAYARYDGHARASGICPGRAPSLPCADMGVGYECTWRTDRPHEVKTLSG